MDKHLLTTMDTFREAGEYWQEKLAGQLNGVQLHKDFNDNGKYRAAFFDLDFGEEAAKGLTARSKGNDLSLYVLLLAAFKVLLFKWTHQQDIITAAPTYSAGDESAGDNKFILFRDNITPAMTFKELILAVNQTVTGGYKNQHYPIDNLLETLGVQNAFPLMGVALLLETIHKNDFFAQGVSEFESDLIVTVNRDNGTLSGQIIYNAAAFSGETICAFADGYRRLLEQALADLNKKISDLSAVSPQDMELVQSTVDLSGSRDPIGNEQSITALFEARARQFPGDIAVSSPVDRDGSLDFNCLTYRELNQRADAIAAALVEKAVSADDIVGLMIRDPLEQAAAMLGTLKAGAAYLPIDADYPEESAAYLIKDSNMKVLITGTGVTHKLQRVVPELEMLFMDRIGGKTGAQSHPSSAGPQNLAYVVYTSGSTGRPKGVLVNRQGVLNYAKWRIDNYRCTRQDVALQLLSYSFDGFGSNFYSTLLSGGQLVLIPASRKLDYFLVNDVIKARGVTNLSLVPGMYEALLEAWGDTGIAGLRFVVLAGERTSGELLDKSIALNPNLEHINEYGPTEATVTAVASVPMNRENTAVIGKPIANTNVYILSPSMEPTPVRAPGQLCIAGAGVARGYLNNPELTAEKFVTFNRSNRSYRTYKTGDLARWLPPAGGAAKATSGGVIEFLGRDDRQVKIRGHRIELGEIENRLLAHPQVKETVVVLKTRKSDGGAGSGDPHIYAYIVSDSPPTVINMKRYMRQNVPGYMVPNYFVLLEKIPLNANGKLDRSALPGFSDDTETKEEFIAPRDPVEEKLAEIWAAVVDIDKDKIGIDNSFFKLGGHSLKVTLVVSKIHKTFNVKIPLVEAFKNFTIRSLAKYVRELTGETFTAIEKAPQKDHYPLSPAQKRMYLMQQMNPNTISYNIPHAVAFTGEVDVARIQDVFKKLILRHEILRTSFVSVDGEPVQVIHGDAPFQLERIDDGDPAAGAEIKPALDRFVRPFDLSRAPAMRVGILETRDRQTIMMVDMHHIISDASSRNILERDFMALYTGQELPPLELQYKDYSHWLGSSKQKQALENQEAFWLKQFDGDIPELNLPVDFERPAAQRFEGAVKVYAVEPGLVKKLQDMALNKGVTVFQALLALYNVLLSKICAQEDIVVGTPVEGRPHDGLEQILGMFVNTLALRNYPRGDKSFNDFLREVSTRTLEAFDNQQYGFEDLVEKVVKKRDESRNPLFNTMLTFETFGAPDTAGQETESAPGAPDSPLQVEQYDYAPPASKFEWTVRAWELGQRLNLSFEYKTSLFKEETMDRYFDYFTRILEQVLEDDSIPLSGIEIAADQRRDEVMARAFDDLEDE